LLYSFVRNIAKYLQIKHTSGQNQRWTKSSTFIVILSTLHLGKVANFATNILLLNIKNNLKKTNSV